MYIPVPRVRDLREHLFENFDESDPAYCDLMDAIDFIEEAKDMILAAYLNTDKP